MSAFTYCVTVCLSLHLVDLHICYAIYAYVYVYAYVYMSLGFGDNVTVTFMPCQQSCIELNRIELIGLCLF